MELHTVVVIAVLFNRRKLSFSESPRRKKKLHVKFKRDFYLPCKKIGLSCD